MPPFRQIEFLYTGLERCRSMFVDGILEALLRSQRISLVRTESDVDQHALGLSLASWRLLRRLYRDRLDPGLLVRMGRQLWLRKGWSPRGRLLRLLRRDLRSAFIGHDRPLVVDHAVVPLLIRAGGGVVYNHGELAFGRENAAMAADWVCVPTSTIADEYMRAGFHADRIEVTGLCVEPSLVAQAITSYEQRMTRLEDGRVITGGIFLDQSEPVPEVRDVVEAVLSVSRQRHCRLFVFCMVAGSVSRRLASELTRRGIPWGHVDGGQGIGAEMHSVTIVQFASRREERGLVARLFAELDYVVVPPREKLLWAAGLGLPVIWLRRATTEVERQTERLGHEFGVAASIYGPKGKTLPGPLVTMLWESGQLEQMARDGWGRHRLDGFDRVAQFLSNLCEESSL